jgi:hypothetical protein
VEARYALPRRVPGLTHPDCPSLTGTIAQWLDDVASLGCVVCILEESIHTPCEVHHLKGDNKARSVREDNRHVIGLCIAHHRTGGQGVAYHAGPRTWEKIHGTQADLLAVTIKLVVNKRRVENLFSRLDLGNE